MKATGDRWHGTLADKETYAQSHGQYCPVVEFTNAKKNIS